MHYLLASIWFDDDTMPLELNEARRVADQLRSRFKVAARAGFSDTSANRISLAVAAFDDESRKLELLYDRICKFIEIDIGYRVMDGSLEIDLVEHGTADN